MSLVVTCKAWGDLSRTPAFWATVLSSFGFDAPRVIAMEPQRAREEAHKFFCERCYVCFERRVHARCFSASVTAHERC